MSTVILLGAGASLSAGYPNANGLFPALEDYSISTLFQIPRDNWSRWTAFRDSEQSGILGFLLKASNPEIALSALDLFPAALDDSAHGLFSIAFAVARGENIHVDEQVRLKARLEDATAIKASAARDALLLCIESFLIDKSHDENKHPEKRAYLREIFHDLRFGDTIITFNWDSTAERTLGEMGLWNPTTGYGFDKGLIRGPHESLDIGVNELVPSPVSVLKLHGSVGWKRSWKRSEPQSEQIFLDDASFLNYLPVSLVGEESPIIFADPEFDGRVHNDPVIVAPTFLKAVPGGKDMQRLWFLAGRALATAKRILVWGYSLPASDGAARVLLNPLRFRLIEENVEVVVTDPSRDARDRWDEFLGRRVSRHGYLGNGPDVDQKDKFTPDSTDTSKPQF